MHRLEIWDKVAVQAGGTRREERRQETYPDPRLRY